MNRKIFTLLLTLGLLLSGCAAKQAAPQTDTIVCTTQQLLRLTQSVTEGTALAEQTELACVVTEAVSCLHDYTLSVRQMELLARSRAVITCGLGLEDFMESALASAPGTRIVASTGVQTLPSDEDPDEPDPHIWLSPAHCAQMAQNVADGLAALYPEDAEQLRENATQYAQAMDALLAYGREQLAGLSCRELVTFHDGFSYFAAAFDLEVAAAMEIESGSEPSARELEDVIGIVRADAIPAVFTEENGTQDAANVVAGETGAAVFTLNMGLSGAAEYREMDIVPGEHAIQDNIDTVKEALQ